MANIVITSTANSIIVDFGDYWRGSGQPKASDMVNGKKSMYPKDEVQEIWQDDVGVFVQMDNRREWNLAVVQGADNFVIDLIDGVAPVDINDLFTKLAALFA